MVYRKYNYARVEIFNKINISCKIKKDLRFAVLQRVSAANMHSLYLMAIQKLPSIISKVDTRAKLTFYSLYKQINEGDADLFPGTQEMT